METVFVSLICIALMVVGGMTMSQGFLHSIDNTSANIDSVSQRNEQIMRTNIQVLDVVQTAANRIEVSLKNSGQTKLASFEKWDVIVHYRDDDSKDYVTWIPFNPVVSDLGDNQWALKGIYIDSVSQIPEVFEPGILNPDEEIIIDSRLEPPVGADTFNLISITTPNGITVSKAFTGYQP